MVAPTIQLLLQSQTERSDSCLPQLRAFAMNPPLNWATRPPLWSHVRRLHWISLLFTGTLKQQRHYDHPENEASTVTPGEGELGQ